jgi:hypothetical protein
MKPLFEMMTDAELKAYALAHRDEIEPLRVLFSRRSPDSEAILFAPPQTEAEWQQQLATILPILEQDRQKGSHKPPDHAE